MAERIGPLRVEQALPEQNLRESDRGLVISHELNFYPGENLFARPAGITGLVSGGSAMVYQLGKTGR